MCISHDSPLLDMLKYSEHVCHLFFFFWPLFSFRPFLGLCFDHEFRSWTWTLSSGFAYLYVSIQQQPTLNVIYLELPRHMSSKKPVHNVQHPIRCSRMRSFTERRWSMLKNVSWHAVEDCGAQNDHLPSVSMSGFCHVVIFFYLNIFLYLSLRFQPNVCINSTWARKPF